MASALRGVVDRDQVGVRQANHGNAGHLGQGAFVRKIGIREMGVPVKSS